MSRTDAHLTGGARQHNHVYIVLVDYSVLGNDLTTDSHQSPKKAFSLFRDVFDPGFPILNIRRYVSPQRHWMRTQEEKSGVPLYSEVYVPMEDAARATKVFVDAAENRLDQIFGKYGGAKYAEERRLLTSYLRNSKTASW